jgi:subtilisin family serine protease
LGNNITKNWITVGASSQKPNKLLPANFSNYGKSSVDLFAPGVQIYSTEPDNNYKTGDGTSFAAPMVTGAAALIKSVYPQLTANEIKEIILKSTVTYSRLKVYLPNQNNKKKVKISFETLSQTAGILNVYEALVLASQYNGQ